jgi:hypothetical protein
VEKLVTKKASTAEEQLLLMILSCKDKEAFNSKGVAELLQLLVNQTEVLVEGIAGAQAKWKANLELYSFSPFLDFGSKILIAFEDFAKNGSLSII